MFIFCMRLLQPISIKKMKERKNAPRKLKLAIEKKLYFCYNLLPIKTGYGLTLAGRLSKGLDHLYGFPFFSNKEKTFSCVVLYTNV